MLFDVSTMASCNQLSRLVRQGISQNEQVASVLGPPRIRQALRYFSADATHHKQHQETHEFLQPNCFVGSWEAPSDPKQAEKMLAQLRRDYAKKVKDVRKEYIHEMEMLRLEKQRKDEVRMQAVRAANEERRRLKAEAAKVRAQERLIAEEEFRKTLMKERAEKLENWRTKEKKREERKKEKQELLRRQSSLWIDEKNLEKSVLDVIINERSF